MFDISSLQALETSCEADAPALVSTLRHQHDSRRLAARANLLAMPQAATRVSSRLAYPWCHWHWWYKPIESPFLSTFSIFPQLALFWGIFAIASSIFLFSTNASRFPKHIIYSEVIYSTLIPFTSQVEFNSHPQDAFYTSNSGQRCRCPLFRHSFCPK